MKKQVFNQPRSLNDWATWSAINCLTAVLDGDETLAATVMESYSPEQMLVVTPEMLLKIPGIGPVKAQRIIGSINLQRSLKRDQTSQGVRITSPKEAFEYLSPRLINPHQEHLFLLPLSTRNTALGYEIITLGTLNTSMVSLQVVFANLIRYPTAAAFIIAHNHPSGDPSPSPEDVHLTRQLIDAGKLMDIALLDHLIIGHNNYVSLKERGLGFELER